MPYEPLPKNPGSDADFTFAYMKRQLDGLPGDITEPTNSAWQLEIVASVEYKVAFLSKYAESSYREEMKALLDQHTLRLQRFGIGAVSSMLELAKISESLNTSSDLDQSA